ncbi:hypothetical protein [Solimonas sp. SE-A11]|uniref:hypothetical protein n=1 Tax=Solimonas sp. SE-A11 TaxID=3054954 RepID=UPI00259D1D37|nr:hypothetical protein [Solimonas sp. SE-A11]MDM4772933.1 hypothetical protein [Solimonas sp. SE-A11]
MTLKIVACPYNACNRPIVPRVDSDFVRFVCMVCPHCGQTIIHITSAADPQPQTLRGYEQKYGSWNGGPCYRGLTVEEAQQRLRGLEAQSKAVPKPEPKQEDPSDDLDFEDSKSG